MNCLVVLNVLYCFGSDFLCFFEEFLKWIDCCCFFDVCWLF